MNRHPTRRPFAFVDPNQIGRFPKKRKVPDIMADKTIAQFTIHRAADMTEAGRHQIADWLRQQAALLETEGPALAPTFTARYFAR